MKWNDRRPTSDVGNISSALQDLKDDKDCADATLVSAGDPHVFAQFKGLKQVFILASVLGVVETHIDHYHDVCYTLIATHIVSWHWQFTGGPRCLGQGGQESRTLVFPSEVIWGPLKRKAEERPRPSMSNYWHRRMWWIKIKSQSQFGDINLITRKSCLQTFRENMHVVQSTPTIICCYGALEIVLVTTVWKLVGYRCGLAFTKLASVAPRTRERRCRQHWRHFTHS